MNKKKMIIISAISLVVFIIGFSAYGKFKTTCFGGNGQACYEQSISYAKHRLLPEAESYAIKACSLKVHEACIQYAKLASEKGELVQARNYYYQACKLHKVGCRESMKFEISQDNIEDALAMSGLACHEDKDPVACYYLGVIKFKQEDYGLGSELMKGSCEHQVGEACYFLAAFHKERKDRDAYLYYLNEACELGLNQACTLMSKE